MSFRNNSASTVLYQVIRVIIDLLVTIHSLNSERPTVPADAVFSCFNPTSQHQALLHAHP
jgi:hypothetical protein